MKTIPVRHLDDTQTTPNLLGNFIIKSLPEMLGGKDMIHELHRHDFHFILVLKKGSGTHEIDFINYTVTDYSVFMIRPGQVHQLKIKSDSIGFMIQFNSEFCSPIEKELCTLLQKVGTKNFYQFQKHRFKKIDVLLSSIFDESKNKQEEYREVVKSYLRIFFIELIRLRNKNLPQSNNKNLYAQERLEEFLQLLETNITSKKQVSQYADMLNLSNYQLNAITKQLVGKTVSELINDQIILESKRYLLATFNQINQIAYHLGYDDVSYFIRFFKKHTGYSPEAFRNNLK
ncbi:AraC family transcriptional regulator [Aquimarina aquimarini]|uniref:AraC family transcriptional regulator n=1 Tax=Aquimarina aquimarini TaxID=1191734 RepID=UPI000D54CA14|nr:AraC family transcriptional regulator [Aquimarina aquimarini]